MAIYHLSVKTISRSAGRSATAAAAYRAGVEITDERTGEIHDYRRKGGVESAAVILPDNAPEWARDRSQLWNAAEQAETRKNSTVAREFEIALPAELSPAERERLAHDFTRELVERHGMAADVAIHAPGKEGDNRNHHAHILLTTRRLTPDGLGEKTRELDSAKTGAAIVKEWRERFAQLQNERLREAGHTAQVDHRSHAERGAQAEPTQHLGPTATAIERRTGERSRKGQQHDRTVAERREKARQAGELERQGKAADQAIDALSGEIRQAKRDQAQQRDQAERERIERMTAAELAAEIERQRPPRVLDLVERDQAVLKADGERLALQNQHTEAGSASARARDQAEAWREAHKVQARLHDMGLRQAPKLRDLEEQRDAQHTEWQRLGPRVLDAEQRARSARDMAQQRIQSDQAPALAKVAELEKLRQAKARQELEHKQRQDAEKRAERERQKVPEDFAAMARKREMKASGWSDRGEQWKAAPERLRGLIDGYNAAPKEARAVILARIVENGRSRGGDKLRDLMAEQRQNYRENDRRMSR